VGRVVGGFGENVEARLTIIDPVWSGYLILADQAVSESDALAEGCVCEDDLSAAGHAKIDIDVLPQGHGGAGLYGGYVEGRALRVGDEGEDDQEREPQIHAKILVLNCWEFNARRLDYMQKPVWPRTNTDGHG